MKPIILQGNALDTLRTRPDRSIQCVVTSPPYWGLRDYGTTLVIWPGTQPLCSGKHNWKNNFCTWCNAWLGSLGLEPYPEMYVMHLVEIFREVRRVLRPDGTLWLNLADTYSGSGQSWGQKRENVSAMQQGNKGTLLGLTKPPVNYRVPGLKKKDLVGIPWAVAFALRNDGWYLRSDIIWHKTNTMPESVTDRPTKSHEYIFLLTRAEDYYYDIDAIREPHKPVSLARTTRPWKGNRDAGRITPSFGGIDSKRMCHPLGRNKRTVWMIATAGFKGKHYAAYPEEIPEICIKAGSRPGDVVMDPFAGAGTTGVVAVKLSRTPLLIELSAKYIRTIIKPRLKAAQLQDKTPVHRRRGDSMNRPAAKVIR
ncbi:MAG: DNA-methyltransferase [Bacteroidota bacterium]